jgi:hypothetical protein
MQKPALKHSTHPQLADVGQIPPRAYYLRLERPTAAQDYQHEARYNILDDTDLKDAAGKMDAFLNKQKKPKLRRVK